MRAAAAAESSMVMVTVEIPAGLAEGQTFRVPAPDGHVYDMVVPADATPGQTLQFPVSMPKAAAATAIRRISQAMNQQEAAAAAAAAHEAASPAAAAAHEAASPAARTPSPVRMVSGVSLDHLDEHAQHGVELVKSGMSKFFDPMAQVAAGAATAEPSVHRPTAAKALRRASAIEREEAVKHEERKRATEARRLSELRARRQGEEKARADASAAAKARADMQRELAAAKAAAAKAREDHEDHQRLQREIDDARKEQLAWEAQKSKEAAAQRAIEAQLEAEAQQQRDTERQMQLDEETEAAAEAAARAAAVAKAKAHKEAAAVKAAEAAALKTAKRATLVASLEVAFIVEDSDESGFITATQQKGLYRGHKLAVKKGLAQRCAKEAAGGPVAQVGIEQVMQGAGAGVLEMYVAKRAAEGEGGAGEGRGSAEEGEGVG
jgi:hypothetical protein